MLFTLCLPSWLPDVGQSPPNPQVSQIEVQSNYLLQLTVTLSLISAQSQTYLLWPTVCYSVEALLWGDPHQLSVSQTTSPGVILSSDLYTLSVLGILYLHVGSDRVCKVPVSPYNVRDEVTISYKFAQDTNWTRAWCMLIQLLVH